MLWIEMHARVIIIIVRQMIFNSNLKWAQPLEQEPLAVSVVLNAGLAYFA